MFPSFLRGAAGVTVSELDPLPVASGLAMPIARRIESTQVDPQISRYDYYNEEGEIIAVLQITDDGAGNATYERLL